MRLLVQSDDYGITRAQAHGVIDGIRNGIIRNTGLFVNMPWSSECVEWIKPYLDQISLGIDLNASTGCSILGHEKVPSLCHADGSFLTSGENRALDNEENNYDHVVYDDLMLEFEAQISAFIKMTGRLPDYFHPHAYTTPTTKKVISDLARKYQRPFSFEFMENHYKETYAKMSWVRMGNPDIQIQSDLKSYLLNDEAGFLKKNTGFLITHCGYCDEEIMKLSSFNLVRMKDLSALMSDEVKKWIDDNRIELVTYNSLEKELNHAVCE